MHAQTFADTQRRQKHSDRNPRRTRVDQQATVYSVRLAESLHPGDAFRPVSGRVYSDEEDSQTDGTSCRQIVARASTAVTFMMAQRPRASERSISMQHSYQRTGNATWMCAPDLAYTPVYVYVYV